MKETYFDDVLIKLKRTYSKDEVVSALSKKLSDLEIEHGKAKSYIQELEDTPKESYYVAYVRLKKKYDKVISQNKKEEEYLKLKSEIKKLDAKISYLRNANTSLSNELLIINNHAQNKPKE